jgi:hypothetical protein
MNTLDNMTDKRRKRWDTRLLRVKELAERHQPIAFGFALLSSGIGVPGPGVRAKGEKGGQLGNDGGPVNLRAQGNVWIDRARRSR